MTYEEFLSRLEGVHRSGNQASARCPAHEDKTASLSVSTGEDGKILLNCHAGCTSREIVEAMGLSLNDLFLSSTEKHGKREAVAQYDYTDESGGFLYRKTRWRMPDGSKSFTWSHKEKDGWKNGRGASPVLYNLSALQKSDRVYLVEGEKDVETLKAHGLIATSPPDGAASKWQQQYTEALKGKAVIILEDNDEPGHKFAYTAACALHGFASSVKLIDLTREWDKLQKHGDISDVLADHPAKDVFWALDALEMQTPEFDPGAEPLVENTFFNLFHTLEDFEEQEAKWLVPGWIPEGQITLLAADGGIGKTSVWCHIAAALSAGKLCFLDPEDYQRSPQQVLFLTTEDSIRQKLRKKLRLAGANLRNITTPDFLKDDSGKLLEIKFGSNLLKDMVQHFKPALCIFDPAQGFVPPEINMGSRNAMRDCMAPLVSLGEECKTAFLIVCHTNKRKGASGRERIADSADLWDISRSVIMMGYTDDQGIRYLSNEKNNYAQLQETLLFSIDGDGQPRKEGTTWKRDREFMQDYAAGKFPKRKEDCKDSILTTLEENGLRMPSKDLEDKLKEQGYSRSTVNRAKAELKEESKIKYVNEGFGGNSKIWFVEKTEFSEPNDEPFETAPPSEI